MPDAPFPDDEQDAGDIMAGDRRLARTDSALPDWYVSDAAYRPIPIAWFAGAMILQVIAQPLVVASLLSAGLPPLAILAVAVFVTGLIWRMTWKRGMKHASTGWRVSTMVMLGFFLGIAALGLLV